MSAKSLSDNAPIIRHRMTVLGRHGFPAENLMLELTETAKLEDARIAAADCCAQAARDFRLSIDDFGTGQSNLEYIEKLPSSELKIDKKSRAAHGQLGRKAAAVVRATIEIRPFARQGGGRRRSRKSLPSPPRWRAMGCDQAQGYLYSPAIPMPELLAMMGGRRIAINS